MKKGRIMERQNGGERGRKKKKRGSNIRTKKISENGRKDGDWRGMEGGVEKGNGKWKSNRRGRKRVGEEGRKRDGRPC